MKSEERREETIALRHTADTPTPEDGLGFEPYVIALAAFLSDPETHPPLTVSIEGEWGSGKSSFMLQLEKALLAQHRAGGKTADCRIVHFNAWRHDKQESVWAAFALDFLQQIGRPWWKHLPARWKLFCVRLKWRGAMWNLAWSVLMLTAVVAGGVFLLKILPTNDASMVSAAVAVAAGLIGVVVKLRTFFVDTLETSLARLIRKPDYHDRTGFVEEFHRDFTEIVRAYAGKAKVYVFIDDLDRCEIPRAADLMQALNLMISPEQPIVYILGLDRRKIAAGLAVKFERLLPYLEDSGRGGTDGEKHVARDGLRFGYDFIEKFVQIPFALPKPRPEDIDKFLDQLVPAPTPEKRHARRTWRPKWWRRWRGARGRGDSGQADLEADQLLEAAEGSPAKHVPRGEQDAEVETAGERFALTIAEDLANDSQGIRDIQKAVAPALDFNPRRLKQFTNLLRLRAYTAYTTGVLGGRDEVSQGRVTLEQLGKFVALQVRYPLLLEDLQSHPHLLSELKNYDSGSDSSDLSAALRQWADHRNLVELLQYGCDEGGADDRDWDISKSGVVERLLEVSPATRTIARAEQRATPVPGPEAPVGSPLVHLDGGAWVSLDGGTFSMGSEKLDSSKPVHDVTVSPFMMTRTPITNLEYRSYVEATGKTPPLHWEEGTIPAGKEKHPVVHVSWTDAAAFCSWLTGRIDANGGAARLPTEAEWEFAASGTGGRKYPWGEKDPTEDHANFGDKVGDTTPVGSYPKGATPEGIQDLGGNVWEWCGDWYGDYPQDSDPDPTGPANGDARVLRGGAFNDDPRSLRAAFRPSARPELHAGLVGFRVVWLSAGGPE